MDPTPKPAPQCQKEPSIWTQKFSKQEIKDLGILVSILTTQGTRSKIVLVIGRTTVFGKDRVHEWVVETQSSLL